MTSAGASFGDQNTELFKVIKGDVVVDLQGAAGLPRTAELIENLYKMLSLKPSHKLINNVTEAQNLWALVCARIRM